MINRLLLIIFFLVGITNVCFSSVKSVGVANTGVGVETGKVKKLLCVGDSITVGVGGDGDGDGSNDWGYRAKLQDQLGIGAFDFVGSIDTPATDPTYDTSHWGNSGQIVQWMVSSVGPTNGLSLELNRAFTNAGADSVVLIHAATNDIILQSIDDASKRTNAAIIADINTLIDKILNFAPDTTIYVGLIVPLRQANQATWWEPFHDDLLAAMTTRRATNPNVHTVDMYNAFLLDYTGDCEGDWYNNCSNVFSGAHPAATGYLVMAKMWARCMADNTAVGCDGN